MATSQKPTTAVVSTREQKGIAGLIQSDAARARLEPLMPAGLTIERLAQEIHFLSKQNPEIMLCTPESLIQSIARALPLDLVFGDTVHIVPFNVNIAPKGQPAEWEKRAQVIVDYKGKAELAIRARCGIRAVVARCVYEGDHFEMMQGLDEKLEHRPSKAAASRGNLVGAYCIVRRGFGASSFEYMPLEDIEEVRAKSKQWSKGPCPPWYAAKTVAHRALKLVPKNPRLAQIMALVDEEERVEFGVAEPMGGTPSRALSPGDEIPTRPDSVDADGVEVDEPDLSDAPFPEELSLDAPARKANAVRDGGR